MGNVEEQTIEGMTVPHGSYHAQRPSDSELIRQAVAQLSNAAMKWHQEKTAERLHRYMDEFTAIISTYSYATLRRLSSVLWESEVQFVADSIITHEETEEVINDLIVLKDEMALNDLAAPGKRSLYLRGIGHYEHIAPQVDGNYPPRRLEQATAILRITAHLKREGIKNLGVPAEDGMKTFAYIADERIRTLLTTHENPVALAELIISRRLTTSEEIEAVLVAMSEIAPALQTGSL